MNNILNKIKSIFTSSNDYNFHINGGTSGYIAGRYSENSMRLFTPSNRSADGDILPNIETIRARSRDLVRNSAVGRGVIGTFVTGVIGEGLKVVPSVNANVLGITEQEALEFERKVEVEFSLWADKTFCDTSGELDFYAIQKLAFKSQLENGDMFALITSKVGNPVYPMSINLIEADLCRTPYAYLSRADLVAGVRKDKYGAPVSYFFSTSRRVLADKTQEVSKYDQQNKQQVLHIYDKERISQTRGVPVIASVMQYVKQLERYSDAELTAAVLAGNFTVFLEDEDMDGMVDRSEYQEAGLTKNDMAIGPGAVVQLDKGKKVAIANPARPNAQYEPFIVSNIKMIGMGMGIPYEVLLKHFASSYSASQGSIMEAHRVFKEKRADFVRAFCKPIYERFVEYAVSSGRIEAPDFFTDPVKRKAYLGALWLGPAKGMIDEYKEARAAAERIDAGISTIKYEVTKNGIRYEDLVRQIKQEREDLGVKEPKSNTPIIIEQEEM